jgi:sterol desaturase/sphingolipid hydroxylase (fatty acid hydroxylase superfamily)
MEKQTFLLYAFPIILLVALLEAAFYRKITGRAFSWLGSGSSTVLGIGYRVSVILSAFATVGLFSWIESVAPWHIEMDRWYHWVALFWGLEFCYYWFHRMNHEVRWWWATHSVHHTPEQMNIAASYRLGWTGHITGSFIFYVPLMFLGFEAKVVYAMLHINLLYQIWLHTELVPKLGWFEYIFNTPSHHRVHHATNPKYLDCNYGGVVIIFDRLFGTFAEEDEREPCRFGLLKQVNTHNPFVIAFQEWGKIFKDLKSAKKLSHALGYLFAQPGWSPDGKGLTTKNIRELYSAERQPVDIGGQSA